MANCRREPVDTEFSDVLSGFSRFNLVNLWISVSGGRGCISVESILFLDVGEPLSWGRRWHYCFQACRCLQRRIGSGEGQEEHQRGTTEDEMVDPSPTRWTWVWASSGSWWWTGKPGLLQSMRVGHNWTTELNWWVKSTPRLSSLVVRLTAHFGERKILVAHPTLFISPLEVEVVGADGLHEPVPET